MVRFNGYKFDFQGNTVLAYNDVGTSGISEWTDFPFPDRVVNISALYSGVAVATQDGTVYLISGGPRLNMMYITVIQPVKNVWEGTNIERVENGGKYILFVSREANTSSVSIKEAFKNLGAQVEILYVDGDVNTNVMTQQLA